MNKVFITLLSVFAVSNALANTILLTPGNLVDIAIHNARVQQASIGAPEKNDCTFLFKENRESMLKSIYNCRLNSYTISQDAVAGQADLKSACVGIKENSEGSSGLEILVYRMKPHFNFKGGHERHMFLEGVASEEQSVTDTRVRAEFNTAKRDLNFEIEKSSLLFGWENAASLYYQCREEISEK